ncbi:GntR family transcriptional regulator [Amycolatopsis benzoatilytica]|uniref:GntR family transcriptional regulator n=1 Tax=Amycolatopsis benzoatilytica TaxID=346045 RepID=UPI00037C6578|nr:GntR family transcriptional regulator [Amycolatopsis benzoatilytica]
MSTTQGTEAGLSKSQRTYQVLRSRITTGAYQAGHRLVLGSLAKEFEVSTVPVREAVRLLQAEGLVHFERNVGATVAAIDPVGYEHTMQMLAIVESAATALAARHLTDDDLAAATGLNDRMRAGLDALDPVEFTRLNQEFHEILYSRCPNPSLVDVVKKGWAQLATIRDSTFSFVPARAAASVAEHDQLLALIRGRSGPEWIEHCARSHRTATLNAFLGWDADAHHS